MRKRIAAAMIAVGMVGWPSAPAGANATKLEWGPCPELGMPTPGLQCTTVVVPASYAEPQGEKLSIAVSRLASTNPAKRRGVLVLNPGGQFDTALGLPLNLVALGLPASVRERFDLIAFDPRGIAHSTRITCNLPPDFFIPPPHAKDAEDVLRQADAARRTAQGCADSPTARLLPHITMANVARDVDQIRESLGEQRISYLGYSLGVYLGAVYGSLFPQRTDRVVLDSAVGVNGMDYTWSRRTGLGFELRFPDFAKWVADRNDTYGFGRTPKEVRAKYFELAQRLDRQPVNGVDGATFRGLTFAFMFSDTTFGFLAQFWQAADQGTVQPFPPPPGDFSGTLALACNQPTWPRDVQTYQRNVERDRVTFPMFGGSSANIWPCAFWPFQPEAPVRINDRGPSNVLIVENLRDPGTPFPGALEMRLALGNRARNLTIDEGGHQAYLFNTNACANTFVSTFLTGNANPVDAFCPGDSLTPQRAATPLDAPALAGLMLR